MPMKNKGRNLLVLFNKKFISRQEEDFLNNLLYITESPEQFCIAHELVDRNRITSQRKKIIKESRRFELRPFRFLINKN
jgi:hypothetical protein